MTLALAEPRFGRSDITYVDDFCGAGGSSQGLREAGLQLVQAANHFERAIETHAANFPDADHLQTDLLLYDMRRRPRPVVYWASPECTWHSPAGGRRRKRQEMLDLFDDYVPNAAGERSRLTMMQVVAFAEAKRPQIVLVENVVEVKDWELFEVWLSAMQALGYRYQILSVSAAHVWSEGNDPAPQWRDRVYFVFSQEGIEFPDVSPRPWAVCPECGDYTRAVQAWKKPDARRIGKYRQQYVYVCPRHPRLVIEPLVSPAMDALDLSDLGERIGDRKRRLAAATERRIRVGAAMFGHAPEIVAHTGHTWDAAKATHLRHGDPDGYYRVASVGEPVMARTSTPGDALVQPYLSTVNHGRADDGRAADPAAGPLPTRSTKLGEALVSPMLAEYYGRGGARPTDEPIGTVTTREHHAMVTPFVDVARTNNAPRDAVEPLAPMTTGRNHSMVTPFTVERRDYDGADAPRVRAVDFEPLSTRTASDRGVHGLASSPYAITLRRNAHPHAIAESALAAVTAGGRHHGVVLPFVSKHHGSVDYARIEHMNKSTLEPLPAIVARPNVSLVTPTRRPKVELSMSEIDQIDISDFRFRMLKWREHATAQRFPTEYVFTGNGSENTLMAGNAVASNVAHYLGLLSRVALGDFDLEHIGLGEALTDGASA